MSPTRSGFTWADHVRLSQHFRRSVNLEQDLEDAALLGGYLVTPLVRETTARISQSLHQESATRAFSITGPYGTGKSALAVFLTHLLAPSTSGSHKRARTLLKRGDQELHARLFHKTGALRQQAGLWPVVASGERRPLDAILLGALKRACLQHWQGRGKRPRVALEICQAAERARGAERFAASEVVRLFAEFADAVASSGKTDSRGLLIVLDEAGRALEYAARHDDSEVQILQDLAELASRSGQTPILFLVLLQQSIEQYAESARAHQRQEWAKVQGRFEDLPFREDTGQILRLMGLALEKQKVPALARRQHSAAVKELVRILSFPSLAKQPDLAESLGATLPLHPVTALALAAFFRSYLAQNERSLFAFLSALEPLGFQEFLQEQQAGPKGDVFYPVDRFFDYVLGNFGNALGGQLGQHWAQAEEAISRLPQTSGGLEARLVKTIAFLSSLGETGGLLPSRDMLAVTFCKAAGATKRELDEALARLEDASIVVYRKYKQAYQLWEGSDLDLERLVREALNRDVEEAYLTRVLRRVAPPRPLVARRHFFETGTLRYFDIEYVHENDLDREAPAPQAADGLILFVFCSEQTNIPSLRAHLQDLARSGLQATNRPTLVALPREASSIWTLAREVAALEWVRTNTPELQSDRVARRELANRLQEVRNRVRAEVVSLLSGRRACAWLSLGEWAQVDSPRQLAALLSDVFDQAYSQAPKIHNEILNRTQLSSAGAAARRELITAMIERGTQQRFGFAGHPPEVAMYRSFFEAHDLCVDDDGALRLKAPSDQTGGSLGPSWQAIQRALEDAAESKVSIERVYDCLKRPPYGLKDGVLPVLLVAYLLVNRDEIGIYEDGIFTPRLTAAVAERFLKNPGKFSLQHYHLSAARSALLAGLLDALGTPHRSAPGSLIAFVRALVRRVADLSDYAKHTHTLSKEARALRDRVLAAKDPAKLVFRDLPEALGFSEFDASKKTNPANLKTLAAELEQALAELEACHGKLFQEVEREIGKSFGTLSTAANIRAQLQDRGLVLQAQVADPRLKSFLQRTLDDGLEHHEWLISVATLLTGKPPDAWTDLDAQRCQGAIQEIGRQFQLAETFAVAGTGSKALRSRRMIRLSVAEPEELERARVLAVPDEEWEKAEAASIAMREALTTATHGLSETTVLASIALLAEKALSGQMNGRNGQG